MELPVADPIEWERQNYPGMEDLW